LVLTAEVPVHLGSRSRQVGTRRLLLGTGIGAGITGLVAIIAEHVNRYRSISRG
jgi:hypothetical protein